MSNVHIDSSCVTDIQRTGIYDIKIFFSSSKVQLFWRVLYQDSFSTNSIANDRIVKNQYAAKLNLIVEHDLIYVFFFLLRHGFGVETLASWGMKILLCSALGLDNNYVEDRIKTIFLYAKPVDDISTASVNVGSVLELSGATSGLAGATLRRGGKFFNG